MSRSDCIAMKDMEKIGKDGKAKKAKKIEKAEKVKKAQKERRIDRASLAGLMREFTPLVMSVARKYEGRGAEREDLAQEGYLALIRIARASSKRGFLRRCARNLPGVVRDAAERMRHPEMCVQFLPYEDEEESGADPAERVADERAADDLEAVEIRSMLERYLDEADLAVALALAEGASRITIAEMFGVTPQCVGRRIERIRRLLREQFYG